MRNNKKVLVLGGAGLIGSHIVENLVTKKFKVTIIDDFSKGKISNLKKVKKKIKIIKLNLEKKFDLSSLFTEHKIIFHLASRAYGVGYSDGNHKKIFLHNKKITDNIFKSLKKSKIDYFQCVSSSCVYRDSGPSRISEKMRLSGKPEKANLGYGMAKRYLENKIKIAAKKNKFNLSIVRPFNIYGDRYKWVGSKSQAIPMLINKVVRSKKKIKIWGSGKQKRNYLYVTDCAEIMIRIFLKRYVKSPINIGYEDTISIKNLVLKISNLAKKNLELNYDLKKPEGRFIKSSDPKLLRQVTSNYRPRINLSKGLKNMLKWHKKNFK